MALRDIDYAAVAVRKAIVEKFGRETGLDDLEVNASEKVITVRQGSKTAEGTRDDLLASIRKATTYDELWEQFAQS